MDSKNFAQSRETGIPPQRRAVKRKAASAVIVPNILILQTLPRWVRPLKASSGTPSQEMDNQDAEKHDAQDQDTQLKHFRQGPTEATFAAGAAVFGLDQIVRADPAWLGCWRLRLALKAAAVASRLLRLNADETALRDAEQLTRPSDNPGPAGRLYRLLRQLTSRPTRFAEETLAGLEVESDGAASGREIIALLRADVALADRLGWERPLLLHITVILDTALRRHPDGKRLCADQPEWLLYQDTVLARAAVSAHAEALTLARKAEVLSAAAGSLRTRDEGRGVAMILSEDSVAPWRMAGQGGAGLGSDRAARRLCESLHAMGALRLLTDRPTFRLYGL